MGPPATRLKRQLKLGSDKAREESYSRLPDEQKKEFVERELRSYTLHCPYTVFTLLSHYSYAALTLYSHCSCTVPRQGWYKVVRKLVRLIPNGVDVKHEVDEVIDACEAMQNLRSAIYDVILTMESALPRKRS
jgi:hypothetical protein